MGLRTADDYLASLNDGREVYYDGERGQDIVGHPVLGQSAVSPPTCRPSLRRTRPSVRRHKMGALDSRENELLPNDTMR